MLFCVYWPLQHVHEDYQITTALWQLPLSVVFHVLGVLQPTQVFPGFWERFTCVAPAYNNLFFSIPQILMYTHPVGLRKTEASFSLFNFCILFGFGFNRVFKVKGWSFGLNWTFCTIQFIHIFLFVAISSSSEGSAYAWLNAIWAKLNRLSMHVNVMLRYILFIWSFTMYSWIFHFYNSFQHYGHIIDLRVWPEGNPSPDCLQISDGWLERKPYLRCIRISFQV